VPQGPRWIADQGRRPTSSWSRAARAVNPGASEDPGRPRRGPAIVIDGLASRAASWVIVDRLQAVRRVRSVTANPVQPPVQRRLEPCCRRSFVDRPRARHRPIAIVTTDRRACLALYYNPGSAQYPDNPCRRQVSVTHVHTPAANSGRGWSRPSRRADRGAGSSASTSRST